MAALAADNVQLQAARANSELVVEQQAARLRELEMEVR